LFGHWAGVLSVADIGEGGYHAVTPGAILLMTLTSTAGHMELRLLHLPQMTGFHPSGPAAVVAQGALPGAFPPRAAS